MAFDFYFAGTQCEEANEIMRKLNANVLKSYVNDKKEILKWFEHKKNGWTGKLMIDNGAFTFHRHGGSLDIDEYIQWLNDNDEYIDYAIALDAIPGVWGMTRTTQDIIDAAEQTWENFNYMVKRVKSPDKILPVFHMGENFGYLRRYLDFEGLKYMCISGSKDLTNAQRESWYEQCWYEIKHSKNPDIKVHCLGSATMSNVKKFPFTSMDATSWIMTGANGSILTDVGVVYVGNRIKLSPIEYEAVNKIVTKYGMTVEQVAEDYKARMVVNVHHLYDISQSVETNYSTITKRRLF